jgi:hypothetical protein
VKALFEQDIITADVPAFLAGVGRSAAGEYGHAPLQRGRGRQANRPCGICAPPFLSRRGAPAHPPTRWTAAAPLALLLARLPWLRLDAAGSGGSVHAQMGNRGARHRAGWLRIEFG